MEPSALLIFAVSLWLIFSAAAEQMTKGAEQKPFTPELKTSDYVWKREISPAGPVVHHQSSRAEALCLSQ
jgi:hypothetical protein